MARILAIDDDEAITDLLSRALVRDGHVVEDGQQVRRDEVLVTMDSTESQADLTTIRQELESAALSAMRLRAQLSGDESLFQPGPGSRAAEVKLQRDLLRESLLIEKARQAAMANELSRNQAERESLMASVDDRCWEPVK